MKLPNTRERYREIHTHATEVGTWLLQMEAVLERTGGELPEELQGVAEKMAFIVAAVERACDVLEGRKPEPAQELN